MRSCAPFFKVVSDGIMTQPSIYCNSLRSLENRSLFSGTIHCFSLRQKSSVIDSSSTHSICRLMTAKTSLQKCFTRKSFPSYFHSAYFFINLISTFTRGHPRKSGVSLFQVPLRTFKVFSLFSLGRHGSFSPRQHRAPGFYLVLFFPPSSLTELRMQRSATPVSAKTASHILE